MGEEQSASLITSLCFFGFLTIAIYYIFLKPALSTTRRRPEQPPATDNTRTTPSATTVATTEELAPFISQSRKPPHATSSNAQVVDGMVSFRHSHASDQEPADTLAETRKERAKVLSRILSLDGSTPPPPRGKIVVLSLSRDENLECSKLRRILYLLATYFTLIVVLNVDDDCKQKEIEQMIHSLRGKEGLPERILPDHRIVAAQSLTGKVALVRQLGQRVEFVLDYDNEMKNELERFGFKVLVYNKENDRKGGSSRLASQLIGSLK
mmetsp:Transcript_22688/g.33502  ORF Transcript_22688/g.33502 Transcript_22688/m.33502 type:complete len:267 (-) Transcript_22688:27-827(-)